MENVTKKNRKVDIAEYNRFENLFSDHRPVYAKFYLTVCKKDFKLYEKIRQEEIDKIANYQMNDSQINYTIITKQKEIQDQMNQNLMDAYNFEEVKIDKDAKSLNSPTNNDQFNLD